MNVFFRAPSEAALAATFHPTENLNAEPTVEQPLPLPEETTSSSPCSSFKPTADPPFSTKTVATKTVAADDVVSNNNKIDGSVIDAATVTKTEDSEVGLK